MGTLDALLSMLSEEWLDSLEDFSEEEKDEVFLFLNIKLVQVQMEMSIITSHSD